MDSYGKKAGKGALIQEEKSATLGVSQDQILFQAANGMSGNNKPCVCSAGFKPLQGAKAKGLGFEMEKSPTLLAGQEPAVCISFEPGIASRDGGHVYENVSGTIRATPGDNQMTVAYTARCGTGGNNVPAVVFENHSQDSRYKGPLKVAQPVTATYGMGGNNQPLVICIATQQGGAEILENMSPTITAAAGMSGNNQPVICLQGNGIDRADTAGCNGKGWREDVSYTLNTIDRPAVVYPKKVAGTLMATGSYCGQDAYNDMFVVENRGGTK